MFVVCHHFIDKPCVIVFCCISGVSLRSQMTVYYALKYNKISNTVMLWWLQNINQTLDSQQTPHSSPSWASYGMSVVRIREKINHVIATLWCIFSISGVSLPSHMAVYQAPHPAGMMPGMAGQPPYQFAHSNQQLFPQQYAGMWQGEYIP